MRSRCRRCVHAPFPVFVRHACGTRRRGRGSRETGGCVMFCHGAGLRSGGRSQGIAASFPSMVPYAPLPEERPFLAHDARVQGGGAGLAANAAASAGRGSFTVIRASFGAKGGTGVPVSRVIACAPAPARFVRLIARAPVRAAAGRAEGARLPPAHAGAFAAPQPVAFCRKAERRSRKPPLSCSFYHSFCQVNPLWKQKMTISGNFLITC